MRSGSVTTEPVCQLWFESIFRTCSSSLDLTWGERGGGGGVVFFLTPPLYTSKDGPDPSRCYSTFLFSPWIHAHTLASCSPLLAVTFILKR